MIFLSCLRSFSPMIFGWLSYCFWGLNFILRRDCASLGGSNTVWRSSSCGWFFRGLVFLMHRISTILYGTCLFGRYCNLDWLVCNWLLGVLTFPSLIVSVVLWQIWVSSGEKVVFEEFRPLACHWNIITNVVTVLCWRFFLSRKLIMLLLTDSDLRLTFRYFCIFLYSYTTCNPLLSLSWGGLRVWYLRYLRCPRHRWGSSTLWAAIWSNTYNMLRSLNSFHWFRHQLLRLICRESFARSSNSSLRLMTFSFFWRLLLLLLLLNLNRRNVCKSIWYIWIQTHIFFLCCDLQLLFITCLFV